MLAAFGVGLANFGGGRHVRPRELAASVGKVLPLVGSYGATGNFVLTHANADQVRAILGGLSGTDWAVMPLHEVNTALQTLSMLPEPRHTVDERATPGLAFAAMPARMGTVESTGRAALRRVSDRVVAVHKLDCLKDGKLDRSHRRGGWGAISADIAGQIGGRWTARSRRMLDGLQQHATERTRSKRR